MEAESKSPDFDRRRFRDRRLPKDLVRPLAEMRVRIQSGGYVDVALEDTACLAELAQALGGRFGLLVSLPDGKARAILPEPLWLEREGRIASGEAEKGLRVMTLELSGDWYSAGLLAIVGRVLTEAEVGAGVVSTARAVHLIMKSAKLKDARVIVDLLVAQAKGRLAGAGGA